MHIRQATSAGCPRYPVTPGSEIWGGACNLPRHRHEQAYAALILSGAYEECGSLGRFRVRPGQVLLHRSFDAHLNRFGSHGAQVLNLVLGQAPAFALGVVPDADDIARLAERDAIAATEALEEQLLPLQSRAEDWPDALAQDLLDDPQLRLEAWAERHGLARETLSRGFGRVFATSPAGFRAEARVQGALALLARGAARLPEVAAAAGFADQPHMTRAVTALTGRSPGYWLKIK